MHGTAALRQISILHVFRPEKLYETMVTPICQLQDGTSKIINLKLHEREFCCIKYCNYKLISSNTPIYYFSYALSNPMQLNAIPYIRTLLRDGASHKEILYFRYTRQIIQNVSSSV